MAKQKYYEECKIGDSFHNWITESEIEAISTIVIKNAAEFLLPEIGKRKIPKHLHSTYVITN